uniref:DCD domain-containing protein n=1 Tax=Kalanchoe fedtschenkoi TaxID=63787 RepID=A0A7N0ZYH3_KALFE
MGSNAANTRNLTKSQLGGVIFGCKNITMQECLHNQLFGLPASHFTYVKNIEPGLPLFLFNYSDRKLHGIFEAASPGLMNIDPYGWTLKGAERTQYPAQVQIRIRQWCRPLPEDQFKRLIADNYYSPHHFWFELDHAQTNKLISKFSSMVFAPGSYQPYYTGKQNLLFHPTPLPEVRRGNEIRKKAFPDTDITSERSTSGGSSDVAPDNDESRRKKDTAYTESVDEAEKDLIYLKLKELALNHEYLNSCLPDSTRDTFAIDRFDLNNEPETVVSSDSLLSAASDAPTSIRSSDSQPTIAQLLEEIKELKTFQSEQAKEMAQVIRRLDDADAEIRRLKDHCSLSESTSDHYLTYSGVVEPESFDENKFDPSELIYLIGGFDGKSWLSTLDVYSPSLDAKKSLSSMSWARSYAPVVKLNGEIYALGGGDGSDWCITVESYNVEADTWTLRASLNSKKGSLAAVSIGDKIFAAGGGDGQQSLSDVEMLDPDVGRWIATRSMLHKRFAPGAVQLNNAIYVTGGFDGQDYLRSVERFDPREHSWTKVESMNIKRGCHSMVVLNEKMYVMGGFDGDKMITSLEVYDPRMGIWMVSESMNHERGYSSAVVVGGGIYVIGGIQTEEKIIGIVERYEEGKGWEVTNLNAIGERCYGAALVM